MPKMKKVIIWVQQYRPSKEAISKEVKALFDYLNKIGRYKATIHDLHFKPSIKLKGNIKSYPFLLYPFAIPFINRINKKYDISHIFTSLGDLPYLKILKKHPNQKMFLTAAASSNITKIKTRIKKLKQLDTIIVESEKQKKFLIKIGVEKSKIKIIYPGIDTNKFKYKKNKNKKFTILFASSPPRIDKFNVRGVNLLLELAKNMDEEIELIFLWRDVGYKKIKKMVSGFNNIKLVNKKITDMNQIYTKADCTIIPYIKFDGFNKLMPNSIMESLAAGKPVLVSTMTEIKDIVQKEKCGIVFKPEIKSLIKAVSTLKKDYIKYQKKCRKCAKKWFSLDRFIKEYKMIYD